MNKILKAGIVSVLIALFAITLSGCLPQNRDGVKTIGIVMPTKALERWNRDGEYLKHNPIVIVCKIQ